MFLNSSKFSKKSTIISLLMAFIFLISFIAAPYADALNVGSGSKENSFVGYRYLNGTQIQVWSDKNIPPTGTTFYPEQFKIYEGTDPGTGRQINVAGVAAGSGSNITNTITGLSRGGSVIITSAESFIRGHVYTIVVTSTLKSNNGLTLGHFNNHEDIVFSFAAPDTPASPNVNGTYSDSIAPVINFYPLKNSINVPVEGLISFSLNVPMDNATATAFSNWTARTSALVLKKGEVSLNYDYTIDGSQNENNIYAPIVSEDRTFVFFPMTGSGGSISYNLDFNASYTLEIPEIRLVNGQTIPAQTISFTTAPDDVPAPFTSVPATSTAGDNLSVTWQSINAVAGVSPAATGYNVWASTDKYFSFVKLNSTPVPAPTTSYVVTGLQPSTSYYFRVTAVNGSAEGGFTDSVQATTPADTTAPTWPDNSALTAHASGSEVALSWPAATDSIAVTGYQVYQGANLLTTVTGSVYNVTGLSTGSYNFSVKAVDATGNPSAALAASVDIDTTLPTWPDGSSLNTTNVTQTGLTLNWTAAADNVGVTRYRIFENGSVVSTVYGATGYNVNGLTADTAYNFRVQAGDAAGNWSADGPTVSINTPAAVVPDTTPPAWPGDSSITVTRLSDSGMTLTWTASTDNVGVNAYNIYQDGSVTGTVYSPETTYTLAGLNSNTSYAFQVLARDAAGNWSASGPDITVKTFEKIASGLTNITVDDSNKNLAVTDSTPANVTVVVPNGVTGASISVINLLGDDGSGNVVTSALPALDITAGTTINAAPVQVAVTIPAGTTVSAPAGWDGTINVPTVQVATQALTNSVTSSGTVSAVIEIGYGDVPLTFSQPVRIVIPGQAGKGVGYYRNGAFTKITCQMSFDSAAALGANTDGYVTVGSDLAIWTKHFTQFVTYTPTPTGGGGGSSSGGPDTQAPTWTNFTLNASKTSGLVTLQWCAATDNVGVTSYKIYLDSTSDSPIATVDGTATTFQYNEGQGTGTHTYYVQALDAAGNGSVCIYATSGGDKPLSYSSSNITTISGNTSTDGATVENSVNVPIRPTIRLVFDKNVVFEDLWANNQQCISLPDSSGVNVEINVFKISDQVNFNERQHIFITPASDLVPGKTYKIMISPGLKAKNGNTLGETTGFSSGKVITFTVAGSAVTTSGPTITTGSGSVDPAVGATISQGDYAKVVIPAKVLKETSLVNVGVKKVDSPPAAPADAKKASDVYEFTVGSNTTYSFAANVAITMSFVTTAIGDDEAPAVFYYDEAQGKWVNIGGLVSGSTITVQVDHFTKFAVFAVKKLGIPVIQTQQGTLSDITGHWAEANIRKLVELGAVNGYPDGSFKPDNTITRAEFATILVKAFKLDLRTARVFQDTAGHWAKDYISTAAVFSIVNGYDADTFGPDDLITREQMAAMTVKAAKLELVNEETKFTDCGSISDWAMSAVATAVKNGIVKGYEDNTVRPQGSATRAEAATVTMNALGLPR